MWVSRKSWKLERGGDKPWAAIWFSKNLLEIPRIPIRPLWKSRSYISTIKNPEKINTLVQLKYAIMLTKWSNITNAWTWQSLLSRFLHNAKRAPVDGLQVKRALCVNEKYRKWRYCESKINVNIFSNSYNHILWKFRFIFIWISG